MARQWGGQRGQSPGGPSSRQKIPVTVPIRTSGYETLECFIATLPTEGVCGRLVHVGETFDRFAEFGL